MDTKAYVHARTGDRVTVLVDSEESAGASFRFEYDAQAITAAPEDHAHPQEERLEVVEGTLHCRLNGVVRVLGPGESLLIPPDALHAVWHGGAGGSRSIGEFRPAGHMQRVFEAVFAAGV